MKHIKRYIFFNVLFIMLTVFSSCKGENADIKNSKEKINWDMERKRMVDTQIIARGVKDSLVLNAMNKVPRHEFVPESHKKYSYIDDPLPIGSEQTISQPYIVALMTELLKVDNNTSRVLEIGTGSGYQAAVLAEIVKEVYTIEIIPELAERAEKDLKRLGYKNVFVKCGDGYRGWKEHSPFDAIIITAAPPKIPEPLIEQLQIGGRMVLPLGDAYQELIVVIKTKDGYKTEENIPVRFVPMTGEVREKK